MKLSKEQLEAIARDLMEMVESVRSELEAIYESERKVA